jgi:tetrahydromethanopterin S-methyltransferase subunit A
MLENLKKEEVENNKSILEKIILLDDETKKEIALNVDETGKLDKLY